MDAPALAVGSLSVATGGALSLDAEEPRRLAQRIADRVSLNPQGVLRSYRDDGHHLVRSFAWLWDQAGHVAAALSAAGAAPGSFVVILVDDIVDFFPAFWGCLRGGFIPVALMSAAKEASYRTDDAFAQAVGELAVPFFIVDEFFAGLRLEPDVRRPGRTVRLGSIVPPDIPWVDFPDVVDPAYLVATSGSTGRPKLVALSNSAVLYRNFVSAHKAPRQSLNGLGAAPLDTITGQHALFLHYDCWTHIPPQTVQARPDAVLDAIEAFECSTVSITSSLMSAILDRLGPTDRPRRLASLRQVGMGGEPIRAAVVRDFARLLERGGAKPDVLAAGYGTTETGTLVTGSRAVLAGDAETGVPLGGPWLGVSMRIVGDDGEILPAGEIGEVEISCPLKMFSGYLGDPQFTAESFTGDGWWRTRDLGQLLAGELILHGRSRDVFIRNGKKFSLVEVDRAVQEVLGARGSGYSCLLPASERRSEGLGVAFDAHGTISAADAAAAIRRAIVRRFGFPPETIAFIRSEDMPRTTGGKIRRNGLSSLVGQPAAPSSPGLAAMDEPSADALRLRLEAIWAEVLGLDGAVQPHQSFFVLGGDSLRAVTLHLGISEAFGVHMPSEVFAADPTFAGLLSRIEEQLAAVKAAPEAGHQAWPLAPRLRQPLLEALKHWPGERVTSDGLVLGFNTAGSRPPLFWVFNDQTEPGSLAAALGSDQPLYAVRSGRDVSDYSEDQIQAIALRYVAEVMQISPAGPLFIAGNCQGGIIALAIGQHLLRRRRHVPLLVLMDWSFPLQSYNGTVLFVGAVENVNLNPRTIFARPELAWQRAFAHAEFASIPGGYAEGFLPGTVDILAGLLARQMAAALAAPPALLPQSGYRVTIEMADLKGEIRSGASRELPVALRNDGDIAWAPTAVSGIVVGSRWLDQRGRIVRGQPRWADIPRLEPNAVATVQLPIVAPDKPGTYTLSLDLSEEGSQWFRKDPWQAACVAMRVTERRLWQTLVGRLLWRHRKSS